MIMMHYQPDIRRTNGKEQIFCGWRRKWVRLTPEEWVRQHFLHYLSEELRYPKNLIAVEKNIAFKTSDGSLQTKRADAVVCLADLTPWMLIEFKAETVSLTRQVWDQAAVYNTRLQVPWLVLHNGLHTIIAKHEKKQLTFFDHLPQYGQTLWIE